MFNSISSSIKDFFSNIFCRSVSSQKQESSNQFLLKKRLNFDVFEEKRQTTEINNSLLINNRIRNSFQEIHTLKKNRAQSRRNSVEPFTLNISIFKKEKEHSKFNVMDESKLLDIEEENDIEKCVQNTINEKNPQSPIKEIDDTTIRKSKFMIKTKVFSLEQNEDSEESNIAAQLNFNDEEMRISEAEKDEEETPQKVRLFIEENSYDPDLINNYAKEKSLPLLPEEEIYMINK